MHLNLGQIVYGNTMLQFDTNANVDASANEASGYGKWNTESLRTSFRQFGLFCGCHLEKRLNILYFNQYSWFTSTCVNIVFRLLILMALFTMDNNAFEFFSPFLCGEAEVGRLQ